MRKWNLIFDVARCTGCQNCTIAVQDEYVGNSFPGYAAEMPRQGPNWVRLERRDRGAFPMVDVAYLFRACQHCDDPPCLAAAEGGAVRKRADGIVVIDPERARGQKAIAEACPYGAVTWNDALDLPQHWNFDAHLLDAGWSAPRPVQACPTGALAAVKLTDEARDRMIAAQEIAPPPGSRHRPRLFYRNLGRYTAEFVGGTLVGQEAGRESCLAGAQVALWQGETRIGETTSDAFGDFRFDGLAAGSRGLRLEATAAGYRAASLTLGDRSWLGEIRLEPEPVPP
jgi:Fe-S-cluster-containing dehydrogenase component